MSKKGSERLQVECYFSFSGGLSAFEFWAVASTRSHFLLPFCRPFLFSRSFVVVVGFCFFFLYILHKRNGTKCYDAVSVDAVTTRELQYGRVRAREKAAAALQTLH